MLFDCKIKKNFHHRNCIRHIRLYLDDFFLILEMKSIIVGRDVVDSQESALLGILFVYVSTWSRILSTKMCVVPVIKLVGSSTC